jgi:glutathione synthase/RimK-type ligase-like ATP-grasp enzyme
MIAIHQNKSVDLFHFLWIYYCDKNNIPYKLVNCYSSDIIQQLQGCSSLMWHYHQAHPTDIVMAKSLLFSLEQSGFKVFPDFNTAWHFDDKVAQKYLLEALAIDLVPTWVFYDKKTAHEWIETTSFPKVFKLKGGAGSQNVQLAKTKQQAKSLANRAFGKGFPAYDSWGSLKERYRKWRLGKTDLFDVTKGVARLVNPPRYAKVIGNEMNYLYFQEFIANNDSDIRIIVIDGKAFGIKRMNRENDFRASGSGFILYEKESIDERFVKAAFEIHKKLNAQCIAYDFVMSGNNQPLLIEISYGFANAGYNECVGYWDEQMNWYEGKFNPYGWIVELMLKNEK